MNCTILVSAAKKTCTIDKCERVNLTIACNFLRIGSCVDSKIYSYSIQKPFIFGDNRNVTMAPFNSGFRSLENNLT